MAARTAPTPSTTASSASASAHVSPSCGCGSCDSGRPVSAAAGLHAVPATRTANRRAGGGAPLSPAQTASADARERRRSMVLRAGR